MAFSNSTPIENITIPSIQLKFLELNSPWKSWLKKKIMEFKVIKVKISQGNIDIWKANNL